MSYRHNYRTLPYFGGKSLAAGKWISSLLHEGPDWPAYVEPYAGMLGVLLKRSPCASEVINDLDGNIVRWWRVVRDKPDELREFLSLTPYACDVYKESVQVLADPPEDDDVRVAAAVAARLYQGYRPTLEGDHGFHHEAWNSEGPRGRASGWANIVDCIPPLTARLRNVLIENTDAISVLEQWLDCPYAVIYLDPPYSQAGNLYSYGPKHEPLMSLLAERDFKANIALSGYPDCPWHQLEEHGWERHEFDTPANFASGERTEVLWTSYTPPGQMTLMSIK